MFAFIIRICQNWYCSITSRDLILLELSYNFKIRIEKKSWDPLNSQCECSTGMWSTQYLQAHCCSMSDDERVYSLWYLEWLKQQLIIWYLINRRQSIAVNPFHFSYELCMCVFTATLPPPPPMTTLEHNNDILIYFSSYLALSNIKFTFLPY